MSRTIDASTVLRRLLDDLDLTQEQFARANDMGIATANRWVNGKVLVTERKLAKAITNAGGDPAAYGIDAPASPVTAPTAEEAPAWFVAHADQLDAKVQLLLDHFGIKP